jgi:hypothetical protein
MGTLEDQVLEELEKEAKEWIGKEYRKRQEIYKKEIEKQIAYAMEQDGQAGASTVRAYHEKCMSMGMSELLQEVQFEADQWIIKEMPKRLEEAKKKS